jgi:uncharacterized membrane protein YdjX (TVP38/TMEM64 family)
MPDRTSVARRLPLVLLLAVAIALFYASGAQQYLSLAGMQSVLAPLREWQAASPLAAAALFFTVYVAMTALSLPGAGVLSLAGGAIFGLAQGLPLVWLAAGTGALLAFLVSRYLARDLVQSRFGEQLRAIDAGIAREGDRAAARVQPSDEPPRDDEAAQPVSHGAHFGTVAEPPLPR